VRFPHTFSSWMTGAGLAALLGMAVTPALAGGPVNILVLKEHGIGSAAQAQPYVDRFVATTAKQNGWAEAKGKYTTTRTAAETFIQSDKPSYGILSLAAFLGLKSKHKLEVIGRVEVARAGGQQYHLISKNAADLGGCKGKPLASDHADDPKFIDKIVFAGNAKLADFTLVQTTRPVQTIKKVVSGDAECALIDDAQFAELGRMDGAAGVKSVWKSEKLPPMVVVAFPSAPAADRKTFQQNLEKTCSGAESATCTEVGIQSMKAASNTDYAAVVTAYDK
jgi:hypothetical protein